jgi:hypothetical protein
VSTAPCKHWWWLQGEAIAVNLREMFGFRVPIFSIVIGEGGSGGALAIGCSNRWVEVGSSCSTRHRGARSPLFVQL